MFSLKVFCETKNTVFKLWPPKIAAKKQLENQISKNNDSKKNQEESKKSKFDPFFPVWRLVADLRYNKNLKNNNNNNKNNNQESKFEFFPVWRQVGDLRYQTHAPGQVGAILGIVHNWSPGWYSHFYHYHHNAIISIIIIIIIDNSKSQ